MKVKLEPKEKEIDTHVGDIIKFNNESCMVIDMGVDSDYYGILSLEGLYAGEVIAKCESLLDIDEDSRTMEVLIKKKDIVILKEEEPCPF